VRAALTPWTTDLSCYAVGITFHNTGHIIDNPQCHHIAVFMACDWLSLILLAATLQT
jgi:hypothetical protein